ncbi:KTSC domain-containing protein [Shewanella eurypsychrophilus]|uniref:KTSC domain-containing protein n=1 Tax=Shewanella eurypsychrophilus TaxID=2593656 RepID=A0ABX6V8G7_9GAMM|nr:MULTISPECIES: KTSC domain-containing protein [Shewanella]QFU23718.1 KTSC domain-containing protein [Shewanella sp. YLB-09]QPG58938.1 KTSC domain-containing protein [Shewanella eurypsychrophilus]
MFTPYAGYLDNKRELAKFQDRFLSSEFPSAGGVRGSYNNDEVAILQVLEVAKQKLKDKPATGEVLSEYFDVLSQFLSGNIVVIGAEYHEIVLQSLAEALVQVLPDINQEQDYASAYTGLSHVMAECSRTILVSHSQGNFYGNAVVEDIYNKFTFPGGWDINKFPMLGQVGIANPSSSVGGEFGNRYNSFTAHITNDNDLLMGAVRNIIGSIDSNFEAEFNNNDWSGHGLVDSYLQSPQQASFIANEILRIAKAMVPVPVYNQSYSSSSVFSSYGSSPKSEILDVNFIYGGGYRYEGLPQSVIEEFELATSQGQYFNVNIKGVYQYEKLVTSGGI